jgi:segregation and condensation protein B
MINLDPENEIEIEHAAAETTASEPDVDALEFGAVELEAEEQDSVEHDAVDHDEAVSQEFDHYESLDEELAGDAGDMSPPKERQLSLMRLEAKVEAIVFASQKPVKASEIIDVLGDPVVAEADVQRTLNDLVAFYEARCGGFRLHYLKRLGYQFQTSEAAGGIMERMFASRPRPISRAALETLSIIAYRQPATRAEVEFIRGVDAGSIFKTLLERELIKCTGRKEIVGRPMLFGTTDQFLTVFNLSSIKDLPPLEAFQPSRDMVQGAMARIEGGSEDDIVDVEEYIADNTRGEYDGDDLALTTEGEDDQFNKRDVTTPGVADGTDAHTEMVVPDGGGFSPGGGDLDQ